MAGCVVVKFVVFSLVLLEYASTSTYCRSVDQSHTTERSITGSTEGFNETFTYPRKKEIDRTAFHPSRRNIRVAAHNPWKQMMPTVVAHPWKRKQFAKESRLRGNIDHEEMMHSAESSRLFKIIHVWQRNGSKPFQFWERLKNSTNSKQYLRYRIGTAKRTYENDFLKRVGDDNNYLLLKLIRDKLDKRKSFKSKRTSTNVLNDNDGAKLAYDWNWWEVTDDSWEITDDPFEVTYDPWEVTHDPWRPYRNIYGTDNSTAIVTGVVCGIFSLFVLCVIVVKLFMLCLKEDTENSSGASSRRLHLPPESGMEFTNPASSRGDGPPDYSTVVVSDLGLRTNSYGVVVPKTVETPPPNYDVVQWGAPALPVIVEER